MFPQTCLCMTLFIMNVAFATLHWYFSWVNGNFINIKPIFPLYSWERKILIFGAVNSWTLDENVCLGLAHFTTWHPKSKRNVYLLLWCQFPCFKWKTWWLHYIVLYTQDSWKVRHYPFWHSKLNIMIIETVHNSTDFVFILNKFLLRKMSFCLEVNCQQPSDHFV